MPDQNSATSTTSERQSRYLLIILFSGFALSGIATTIVGPMLPLFIRRWSLDDGQAGLFSTVQFLAALAGTLASSVIASWRGYRSAIILGYALTGGGLAALNADTRIVALEATAVFGLGYGFMTAGTNLFVAELGGAKSASLLNLLNFTWGAGAMACSTLITLALHRNFLPSLLIAFAAFAGLLCLGLLLVPFNSERHRQNANPQENLPAQIGWAITIPLAALFFIYVATENGVGIWAAEYAKRLAHGIKATTTLAPSFFYAGLTFGRVSAPLVLQRFAERKIVLSALTLTTGGIALLIASPTVAVALLSLTLAGLGCASVYPIFIAWLSRWYGSSAKKIGGIFFALASLGGSVGPGAVGFLSKFSSSLRVGMLAPLAATIAMFLLVLVLRKQTAA